MLSSGGEGATARNTLQLRKYEQNLDTVPV